MTRSGFIAVLGAGLMAVMLAGCSSFAPVYGGPSGADMAAARFNFAPPNNRTEQLILNRLRLSFPATATPTDPVLRVEARRRSLGAPLSDAFDVARPAPLRVEASVSIEQGDATLFEATRFTDTAFQGGKLTPTNIASATGAEENAARSTAESLRAAILAGYRPETAMVSGSAMSAVSTPPR